MTRRPDSFNQQLLNPNRDSHGSHEIDIPLGSPASPESARGGGYPSFPSPQRSPQLPPIPSPDSTSLAPAEAGSSSMSQQPRVSSPSPSPNPSGDGRPSSNLNTRDLPPVPTTVSPPRSAANNDSNNDSNITNGNGYNNPPAANGNHENTDQQAASQNDPSVPQTTLQRNPSRPPPRYETLRNTLVVLPRRIRHSVAAMGHEFNDQFAPRQRRRPSANGHHNHHHNNNNNHVQHHRTNSSRAELRMSSTSATPYDVDLMPPALAVIGFVSSFLVLIALIVFVKISQFAANIVGIAYSASVLAASSIVVVRYWLEKQHLKKRILEMEEDGGGGRHRRWNSVRRMAMLGRRRQALAAAQRGTVGDESIEAGQAHEEMEMRGEIIVVPIQPVARGHEVLEEADPELPPYSPRRDQVIHVT